MGKKRSLTPLRGQRQGKSYRLGTAQFKGAHVTLDGGLRGLAVGYRHGASLYLDGPVGSNVGRKRGWLRCGRKLHAVGIRGAVNDQGLLRLGLLCAAKPRANRKRVVLKHPPVLGEPGGKAFADRCPGRSTLEGVIVYVDDGITGISAVCL